MANYISISQRMISRRSSNKNTRSIQRCIKKVKVNCLQGSVERSHTHSPPFALSTLPSLTLRMGQSDCLDEFAVQPARRDGICWPETGSLLCAGPLSSVFCSPMYTSVNVSIIFCEPIFDASLSLMWSFTEVCVTV